MGNGSISSPACCSSPRAFFIEIILILVISIDSIPLSSLTASWIIRCATNDYSSRFSVEFSLFTENPLLNNLEIFIYITTITRGIYPFKSAFKPFKRSSSNDTIFIVPKVIHRIRIKKKLTSLYFHLTDSESVVVDTLFKEPLLYLV